MSEKNCFVIAPIGEEGSDTRQRSDEILDFILEPAAQECGYKAIRADKISEPGMITTQVIQHLINSPLVIADLTEQNANVFYELAIRHVMKKPLVQIIEKGEKIPFDVANARTIHVDHTNMRSVDEAKKEIVAQIKSFESSSTIIDTPFSNAISQQFLTESENPEQRSLADIISLITEVRNSVVNMTTEDIYKDNSRHERYLEMEIKYRDVREKYQNLKNESLVDPKIYRNFEHIQNALENLLDKLIQDAIFQSEPLKIRVLGICFHKSFTFIKEFVEENCNLGKRIEIRLSHLDRSSPPASILDEDWKKYYDTYETQLEEFIQRIKKIKKANISLKISMYSYMPNWHGIMINNTHLFLSACVWNNNKCMTAGENHYVYYKKEASWLHNQKILQFTRWFDYGRSNSTVKKEEELIFDTEKT